MRKRRCVLLVLGCVMSVSLAHAGVQDTTAPTAAFQTRDETVEASLYPAYQDLVGGTATDDSSGVARVTVTFTAAGTGAVTTNTANLGCTDGTMRTCMWRIVTPLLPGEYVATARATDRAGNTQTNLPHVLIFVI